LSEPPIPGPDPAVGLLEFSSIATGIVAGDAMVKSSPVGSIYAGTVHPGKYLVLVSGDTASVGEALDVGRDVGAGALLDSLFLPDIHPAVTGSIVVGVDVAWGEDEALGIVETHTVAAAIEAADAGVKAAEVEVGAVRLADGLGGKGYVLFFGVVADVQAAMEAAAARVADRLVAHTVIPQLHDAMAENLARDLRFMARIEARSEERGLIE
jgi:microcompartment protein CcmL/EutN